jgi:hypothetical protein
MRNAYIILVVKSEGITLEDTINMDLNDSLVTGSECALCSVEGEDIIN